MKNKKLFTLVAVTLLGAAFATAQTADEIINKHLAAIGGKELLTQINSVYMEGTLDVMGTQGSIKMTQVNGKGQKQEIDVMGNQIIMCITDSSGWQINPMAGSYGAEDMPESQYKSSRDQIYIGGPFVTDYLANGYKVELLGQETVNNVNAYKIQVFSPDSTEYLYFFDPETFYILRSTIKAEMMGQVMDVETNYSDYQKADNGYVMPHGIEINYGGQFFLVTKITSVEINKEIDPAVFAKP